jgi:ComF family protein
MLAQPNQHPVSLVRPVLNLFWPHRCYLCQLFVPDTEPLSFCTACVSLLTNEPTLTCPRCATRVGPYAINPDGCPRCVKETYRFDSATRLGEYDGVLRDAVLRCKQAGQEGLAEHLGRLFARVRLKDKTTLAPQAVVPVPLHWSRRLIRQYNQAEAMAHGVARELGIPVITGAVVRHRRTPRLADQSPTERRVLMKTAFRPGKTTKLQGLRVLLVDDVLTTGATASAVSTAILAAGAAQVDLAILAHR